MMKRILVVTLGSLGDLYPLLKLCDALRQAGAEVRCAAPAIYGDECRRHNVNFVGIGVTDDYASSVGHAHSGRDGSDGIAVAERLAFENFHLLFDQLYAAAGDVDLIVTVLHAIPAHFVAEKRGIPYVVVVMSPAFTQRARHWQQADDEEIKVPARWNAMLSQLRRFYGLSRRILPYQAIFNDAAALLGLFPKFLMSDRAHLEKLQVVGHAQTANPPAAVADAALASFCSERPVVFSFGSYVDACDPDYFLRESVAACRLLGLKCLYVSRHVTSTAEQVSGRGDLLIRPFVPHAAIFPAAAAVVHHGGLGTLMEACRSAQPMVIVPFMHDQPYHAERMRDLVDAAIVPSRQYSRDRIAQALQQVIAGAELMRCRLKALMAGETEGSPVAATRILELFAHGSPQSVVEQSERARQLVHGAAS